MYLYHEFLAHWYINLSIPIVAAIIGYVTKLVAIRMMFRPLEFRGYRPYFGWQGIVPRRAARMSSIAVDTMTRDLVSAREVLGNLDPQEMVQVLEAPLRDAAEDITRTIMSQYQPGVWDALPVPAKRLLIGRVQAETPKIVATVITEVQDDPDAVFDLKAMVLTNLLADKALLNRIFIEAGHKEFRFIARSGIYFGGLIGLLQLTLWLIFKEPLIMPAFGLVVGWFTDWLALKLIFNPKKPHKIFGYTFQGRFLKRRREVARDYGALIADELITPRNILESVLRGPLSDRLFAVVRREVEDAIARNTTFVRPLVVLTVGSSRYQEMKDAITAQVMDRLPDTLLQLEGYARDTMDLRNTLVTKMADLNERQFEALIRPAFEADEWILITVGAILGFVMGECQALVLEHFAR